MSSIQEWSESFTEEIYEKWQNDYSDVKTGVKTFYTPVHQKPRLMIIGYNPGGSEESFRKDKRRFENGNFSNPDESELWTKEYTLARKFRNKIFADHEELLKDAVKFDLIFFRSKKADYLKERLGEDYREALEYCYRKSREIIEKLEPEAILLYGISTYDKFQEEFREGFEHLETVESESNNRRIFCKGRWKDTPVFGIIHPTGAFVSDKELDKVKEKLFSELD